MKQSTRHDPINHIYTGNMINSFDAKKTKENLMSTLLAMIQMLKMIVPALGLNELIFFNNKHLNNASNIHGK